MTVHLSIICDKEIYSMNKPYREMTDHLEETDISVDDLPELTPEEADIIERQIDALYEGPEFQCRLEAYYERTENKIT